MLCMLRENFCMLQKFYTLYLQPRKTPLMPLNEGGRLWGWKKDKISGLLGDHHLVVKCWIKKLTYLCLLVCWSMSITASSTLPNWLKYALTSSAEVSWLTPPTKIFLVLLALDLLLGVACLGSIFFPSSECDGTASTLSTESGAEKVMKPNPRLLCKWELIMWKQLNNLT